MLIVLRDAKGDANESSSSRFHFDRRGRGGVAGGSSLCPDLSRGCRQDDETHSGGGDSAHRRRPSGSVGSLFQRDHRSAGAAGESGRKRVLHRRSRPDGLARSGGGGGRGGRGGGANIDPETGQPALQVHYDTSQFGLSGNTIVRSASLRTSIITGPEGKVPPLTPEAQKRQADQRAYNAQHQWDGPESRPLAERCIMWGNEGPPMMPAGYNADLQIVQGEGYVSVVQEMIHDTRVIPTDGRPHLPDSVHQWFGDARGHWENDKLVVETTNFTNRTSVQNTPTTDKLKVVEKFSRVDANTVLYEVTVDDPGTWTKPWSGEIAMTKLDTPVYEYACHEGNYGMANNLSGARATEKK